MQIINMSAKRIAKAIQRKELSAVEVVEAFIKRIRTVNPKLNAVVQLADEAALDDARKADQLLARGEIMGPLHGVPMTLKDSFDSAGIITTGGTLGRKNFRPKQDATVLSRLRKNGAILLGKTNTPEFTLMYETNNLVYGKTNNPYDLSCSPGGSSGGAAAIIAAKGSPFDIGSDYGGSLRYPAHCCGITSIKPTSGRVPRTGHILPFGGVLDSFQQVGPMANYVEDLALILPLISGPDWIDPSIVPMPPGNAERINIGKLRIAFHTDNGITPASDEVGQGIRKIADLIADDALLVEETKPNAIEQTYEIMMDLLSADGGASIRRLLHESNTEEHSIPWLGLANPMDATAFDALIMKWYHFKSAMLSFFKDYDVILSPVNTQPALPHSSIRDELQGFSYTMTYNLTGWPVTVIRAGTTSKGLPIGIQIVAAPWREDISLALAAYLEKTSGEFQSPVL